LKTGWYKVIATGKDKYGEEIKAEKFILITGSDPQTIETKAPILVDVLKQIAQPGEKITYDITTGFDKIWLIQNIVRPNENYKITYPTVSNGERFTNSIDVTEADRGGINMNYVFVQHNRVYTGTGKH